MSEDFLDAQPTASRVEVFNHEKGFGVQIHVSEKGWGFGSFTFYVDKASGAVSFDDEATSLERCGEMIMRAVGTTVLAEEPERAASAESEER